MRRLKCRVIKEGGSCHWRGVRVQGYRFPPGKKFRVKFVTEDVVLKGTNRFYVRGNEGIF